MLSPTVLVLVTVLLIVVDALLFMMLFCSLLIIASASAFPAKAPLSFLLIVVRATFPVPHHQLSCHTNACKYDALCLITDRLRFLPWYPYDALRGAADRPRCFPFAVAILSRIFLMLANLLLFVVDALAPP